MGHVAAGGGTRLESCPPATAVPIPVRTPMLAAGGLLTTAVRTLCTCRTKQITQRHPTSAACLMPALKDPVLADTATSTTVSSDLQFTAEGFLLTVSNTSVMQLHEYYRSEASDVLGREESPGAPEGAWGGGVPGWVAAQDRSRAGLPQSAVQGSTSPPSHAATSSPAVAYGPCAIMQHLKLYRDQ